MQEEGVLKIEIRNNQPVELFDLTNTFINLCEHYRHFIADYKIRYKETVLPENIKLYIKEIKTGSIITDLVAFAPCVLPIALQVNTIIEFSIHLKNSYYYFLGKNNKPRTYEKHEYNQFSNIIEPIAKDHGSQINISTTINGDVHLNFGLNSMEANAIQNAIERELKLISATQKDRHEKVLLYLYQAKGDVDSNTGNKGIIEKISLSPIKVIFDNEEIKRNVLLNVKNPFLMAYIVDVEVDTIEGRPALYKIVAFHECFDKPKH
ncbi:MAG: hypothetical protein QY317_16345 [Candidatus Jettenia caeni]|nr:MAG: hypothetical protein QY317_16345 [Candidatus Jettenia caeni]